MAPGTNTRSPSRRRHRLGLGRNSSGQLGDGTLTEHDTPEQVVGLSRVRQVAAGYDHSLAVRSDGTLWAWGANDHGQVGNGVVGANQLASRRAPHNVTFCPCRCASCAA